MRYSKSFLPLVALFFAISSNASPTQEKQLEERQISLNPASSCPQGQLSCCNSIGLDGTTAGPLVLLGILDPTGLSSVGVGCTALSFPLNLSCASPAKPVCCDPDIPLLGTVFKVNCKTVNPLL